MNINPYSQQLMLQQLCSPSLPIGSFAYSQGLEYAIDDQWCEDVGAIESWIAGVMEFSLGHLDLPIILRIRSALKQSDFSNVQTWNHFILAHRETKELYDEDCQVGRAFLRLLNDLSLDTNSSPFAAQSSVSYASAFGYATHLCEIDIVSALHGYCWSWLDNQIAAAVKLLPMGQTDAQKMAFRMFDVIETTCAWAMDVKDEELGASLPGLGIASSLHETQYSRLFRS